MSDLGNTAPLAEVLDMVPLEEALPEVVVVETEVVDVTEQYEVFKDDFDSARENIDALIKTGKEALSDLVGIAKQSQHPRAFEVVSTLIKTLVDASKDMVGLHETKKKIEGPNSPATPVGGDTNNTQQNIFVGSTAELARALNELKAIASDKHETAQ